MKTKDGKVRAEPKTIDTPDLHVVRYHVGAA